MAQASPEETRHEILEWLGRDIISNSYPGCVLELAQLAVDTTYPGFEDPRSAANFRLGDMVHYQDPVGQRAFCDKEGCEVSVKVNLLDDSFDIQGECPIQDTCIKDLWEDRKDSEQSYKTLQKAGRHFASKNSAGNRCPHLACTYSCGFSIDGVAGSVGVCKND